MSSTAKLFCGIILLTVPSIQYGGFFLLSILTSRSNLQLTDFQKSMFRAGHAHAGVLVILALIAELFLDHVSLAVFPVWILRVGFPIAAILISGGFFASAAGKKVDKPNQLLWILYTGVGILAICLIILGLGLIIS